MRASRRWTCWVKARAVPCSARTTFIEDYCKGQHIVYDIPLEEEFDISKLKFKIADISERIEIVEGISYEGQDFDLYKGYGSTDSKGYYYTLKQEYKND